MFTLTNYYQRSANSGIIGAIVTVLIYLALMVLNSFIFYNYLVFLHMEGRIIDIYTRVTADASYFFIPMDNEVSARYLRWVIAKVKHDNSVAHSSKHAAVTSHTVIDASAGYQRKLSHISIFRRSTILRCNPGIGEDGKLVLYRHFVKSDDGAICELEEGTSFTVDEHPLLEVWPTRVRKPLDSADQSLDKSVGKKRSNDCCLPTLGAPQAFEGDVQGSYRLEMSADTPLGMKASNDSLPEQQMFMIKGD